jgi:hypothetical protein
VEQQQQQHFYLNIVKNSTPKIKKKHTHTHTHHNITFLVQKNDATLIDYT